MNSTLKAFIIGVVLLVLFGIVGRMDYEDGQLFLRDYCEGVKNGAWPDYKEIFDESCGFLKK